MRNFSQLSKTMSLTPEVLLSSTSRQQCIAKLKNLPLLMKNSDNKVKAAVLVPICVVDNEVNLLYTLRSSNLTKHSGQISFPGGKMDEGEDEFQTALRETEEEIGFLPKDVDIWSKMNLVQGRDENMAIMPVVGELKNFDMTKLRANEDEVAEIFTVPIKVLANKDNHACFNFNKLPIPIFICGKHKVWGITGMITHWFLQCLLPEDAYQVDFTKREYKLEDLLPSKI